MTFPSVELKFSRIDRNDARTESLVRMYRLDDGGLNDRGDQQYQRTLLRTEMITLERGAANGRLVAVARTNLRAWAREAGYDLPEGRLVCALP